MIRHEEPLLYPQEHEIPLLGFRLTPIPIGQRVPKQHLGSNHIGSGRRSTELLKPTPMTHVVVLGRAEAGACDEPVLGTDELAGEEGCEVRVRVGQVGDGEVAREGSFGEIDVLCCTWSDGARSSRWRVLTKSRTSTS